MAVVFKKQTKNVNFSYVQHETRTVVKWLSLKGITRCNPLGGWEHEQSFHYVFSSQQVDADRLQV